MARTKPGTDFPTRSEKLLSQTEGQCRGLISTVEEEEDAQSDGWRRRVTVREVLKYSLTWVIIPSVTVQAWTQDIWRLWSQPSVTTVVGPNVSICKGVKTKSEEEDDDVDDDLLPPVRRRIIYWWVGGPWNHHSRSEARILWTVTTSRDFKAS